MALHQRNLKDPIDAIQFVGLNDEQQQLAMMTEYPPWYITAKEADIIKVIKGKLYVTAHKNPFMSDECQPGDWIICNPTIGNIWTCPRETFDALYTKV